MLRWLGLAVCFIFFTPGMGQSLVDSIKSTIANSVSLRDSSMVNFLVENPGSDEECVDRSQLAVELAQKIGYEKGLGYAYKSLGFCYYNQANYVECIYNWEEALRVFQQNKDLVGEANMLSNLGVAYNELGDGVKALEYSFSSLKVAEASGDKKRIGTSLVNIGANYEENPVTRDKALDYFLQASILFKEIEYTEGLATCYGNMGEIMLYQGENEKALEYLEEARKRFESLQDFQKLSYTLSYIGKTFQKMGDYSAAIKIQNQAYKMSLERNNKFQTATALLGLGETFAIVRQYDQALEKYNEAKKVAVEIGSSYELKNVYEGLVPVYTALGDYKNALRNQQLLAEINDKLFSQENAKTIQRFQLEFELEKKQAQINLLTKDKALQEAEIAKNKVIRNALITGVILLVLLAFFFFRNYQIKAKANRMLAEQNVEILQQKEEIEAQRDDIESQKVEIENLILNILPLEVAQELRKTGTATPRSHESVTVLFTDFKEFTKIAENMSAQELVEELNACFIEFDRIIEDHGLEKIKTIGDAYMCACGIPSPVEDHPLRTVRAALDIQRYISKVNEKRIATGAALWELRIGIHTGPLTAGVVGRKKFAYDIWGNTVNIAARLETAGQVGKVNISETTFGLIRNSFECKHRGKIMTKNLGEIDMYFVEKEVLQEDVMPSIEA